MHLLADLFRWVQWAFLKKTKAVFFIYSIFIVDFSLGIWTLKVDGRPNDSTAKHPSLGNCNHLMPAYCYLHRVHQQRGHCNALLTCVSLHGEFLERDDMVDWKSKQRRRQNLRLLETDNYFRLLWSSELKCHYTVHFILKRFLRLERGFETTPCASWPIFPCLATHLVGNSCWICWVPFPGPLLPLIICQTHQFFSNCAL